MESNYESEENISIELEKICGEWGIYAKQVERSRPQQSTSDSKGTIRLLKP